MNLPLPNVTSDVYISIFGSIQWKININKLNISHNSPQLISRLSFLKVIAIFTIILNFIVKSACDSNALASYIHQHSWVQFAQLTLAMAGSVFEQGEGRTLEGDTVEYTDTAAALLTQCLTLVTDCLQKVSIVNNKGTCASTLHVVWYEYALCLCANLSMLSRSHKEKNDQIIQAIGWYILIKQIKPTQHFWSHGDCSHTLRTNSYPFSEQRCPCGVELFS